MDDETRARLRHDARTPINQIIGYSELLEEELRDRGHGDLAPDLARIKAAALELLAQVDALLAASTDGTATDPPPPEGDDARPGPGSESPEHAAASAPIEAIDPLLVVDDSAANRDMLSRRLMARGYAVDVAEDGPRALEMVAARPYAMLLLDVIMPGMSGLEVLSRLRRTHTRSALPVIMATARHDSRVIVDSLRRGANDYVTKPLDFAVVLARVEAQLSLKAAAEKVQRLADELDVKNQFIRSAFGRYLSDAVVAEVLERPDGLKLGGEKRTVTILMCDLRGFTAVVARLAPQEVVTLLNNYLAAMTDVIAHHDGTIDEFIGDAILAIFGAPQQRDDDAARAVACAASMQAKMREVNEQNGRLGLPAVQMGIGVHTGDAVVGNIGSPTRLKYGVVGSAPNITSRIEASTVGGQVLLSASTLAAAGPSVTVRRSFTIRGKGMSDAMQVYELAGVVGAHACELPDSVATTTPLAREIAVVYRLVGEDKRVAEESFTGRLVALAPGGAEMCGETLVEELTNLHVRVLDDSRIELPGEIYAKVVRVASTDERRFLVRWTSTPPELELFLAARSD